MFNNKEGYQILEGMPCGNNLGICRVDINIHIREALSICSQNAFSRVLRDKRQSVKLTVLMFVIHIGIILGKVWTKRFADNTIYAL